MGKTQYLIDSNAIIDYLMGKIPAKNKTFMDNVINAIPKVSVINKIEVLGYKSDNKTERLLTNFFNDAQVFDITDSIVNTTIQLRKDYKIKLPDAIIAATAIEYDLAIITRNTKDFKAMTKIKTINPHQMPV